VCIYIYIYIQTKKLDVFCWKPGTVVLFFLLIFEMVYHISVAEASSGCMQTDVRAMLDLLSSLTS